MVTEQNESSNDPAEPIISVILPTRERLKKAEDFLLSLKKNCTKPDLVEIVVCIDDDDKSYEELEPVFKLTKVIKKKRRGLGAIIFEGIKNSRGEIIFLCNDDVKVRTAAWDKEFRKVHNSFTDEIYLFSPNDLNKKGSLFVFPGFSKKVFKILNNYPKGYAGAFMDNHLYEIFESLKYHGQDRKVFLREVIFEHQHYKVTGEIPDKTYLDRNRFGDDFIFFSSVKTRFLEAMSLKSYIETRQIHKKKPEIKTSIKGAAVFYLCSSYLPFRVRLRTLFYMLARFLFRIVTK